MPDKDTVIKAIECRYQRNYRCGNPCEQTGLCHYAKAIVGPDGYTYKPYFCNVEQLCIDALALLKEQETELCDRCGRKRLKSSREGG